MSVFYFPQDVMNHRNLVGGSAKKKIADLEAQIESVNKILDQSTGWHDRVLNTVQDVCMLMASLEGQLRASPERRGARVIKIEDIESLFTEFYKIWPRDLMEAIEEHEKFLKRVDEGDFDKDQK